MSAPKSINVQNATVRVPRRGLNCTLYPGGYKEMSFILADAIAPSYMVQNAGGGGGELRVSANEYRTDGQNLFLRYPHSQNV